jgi:PAS domain S-box-containing protein
MPTFTSLIDDGLGEDIRQILDAIPAAVFVKDAKGRYIIVNRMCEQVWGISRDELLMSDGSSHFKREELDFFLAMDREVFVRGTEQNYKTSYFHQTRNAYRAGHTFKRPIYDDHGNPRFVVCVAFDTSDQEYGETNTIEADQKLRGLLGQMASALAHEVNQPLTAMSNWIQAARHHLIKADPNPPPKVLEFLDNAVKQANFAARIIANLRRFVTSGELSTQEASINRTIEDVFRLATMGAHKGGVTACLNLASDLPMVLIDRTQIQQVVINLARNAIEAMADCPVRILTISTLLVDDQVEVSIGDTGPGLDSYVAERLFKPFVTTKSNGMGMGLSICQTILESHGGRLWAEPGIGQGSVFSFSLPCVVPCADIGA